ISPAGSIPAASPAGQYLVSLGVKPVDFNQYGTRRGNHEVLIRGTFANIRLRNGLVEREGWWTKHLPSGEEMTIYDASMRYQREGTPLVILAAKEYGSGSSRDSAAKCPLLLGVRAVIADTFERIHSSSPRRARLTRSRAFATSAASTWLPAGYGSTVPRRPNFRYTGAATRMRSGISWYRMKPPMLSGHSMYTSSGSDAAARIAAISA